MFCIHFLTSRTKDHKDEVAELETQLKFLGMIDLHVVATTHLRQKINKHHTLKHVELPAAVTALLPISSSVDASSEASKSPALVGKVENRLCSGKQVADAIKPVVSWVLSEPGATLNVAAKPAPKKAGGARKLMVDESDDDEGSIGDAEDDPEPLGAVTALESDDEAVIEDRAADDAGWESGDFGGEDDGDADGWESGSVGGSGSESDTAPPAKRAKKTKEDKPAKPAPAPKAAAARPPRADGSSSMFLPSLAAGFTAGDSDSDPDMDYDPTGTIGTKAPPRKNRRGQRARQA
jgi:hypothetical protein